MVTFSRSPATAIAAVALVALAVSGCSSTSSETADGGGSRLANLLAFNTSTPTTVNVDRQTVYCPGVSVQPGTSAYQQFERGQEGSILAVRYQASFGEIVRECVQQPNGVGVRVGISGRLMVGPKGTPGVTVDVPVRFVALDSEDRPVISRVTRIQASIPQGASGVSFTHVEELGVLPVDGTAIRSWAFRVGFDTPTGR
jgi:hypothetical protein